MLNSACRAPIVDFSFATITGARAVNDPGAINIAQVVISSTVQHMPKGIISMPAFGGGYSDIEIAAVANYITHRASAARHPS